jgi:hypothetical protein
MSTNYKVAVGATPLADDVNQFADTLTGANDAGPITLASPTAAPASGGTATATTGTTLGVGTYVYVVTYVTGIKKGASYVVTGETIAGPTFNVTTTTGNQSVSLTSLPSTSATQVVAKRIYRTVVGGAQLKRLVELAPGTVSYVDTTTDGALGANVPTSNTTGTSFTTPSMTATTATVTTATVTTLNATNVSASAKHELSLQDVLFWMSI